MRGEPDNPHAPGEVERKFFDLARPVWGQALSDTVYRDSLRLERIADMRGFAGGADL
jgi:hypothetical protein